MRDQYGPVSEVEAVVALAREPKEMVWISEADHFFASKLDDVRQAIRAWGQGCFPLLRQ
jgi:alpha/beta superfamily hydrolase